MGQEGQLLLLCNTHTGESVENLPQLPHLPHFPAPPTTRQKNLNLIRITKRTHAEIEHPRVQPTCSKNGPPISTLGGNPRRQGPEQAQKQAATILGGRTTPRTNTMSTFDMAQMAALYNQRAQVPLDNTEGARSPSRRQPRVGQGRRTQGPLPASNADIDIADEQIRAGLAERHNEPRYAK